MIMISRIQRFLNDRRSVNLPRSQYQLDHFDPQPGDVLQLLIVPGFFLSLSTVLWIAVGIASMSTKLEPIPLPDPKIVKILNNTYFSINAIKYLNDSARTNQILKEWEEASQEWTEDDTSDGAVSDALTSIAVNLRGVCELVKPENDEPLQLLEFNALQQGFLNGAMRSAERLRKLNGLSFAEAHGSSKFVEASTDFLDEASRILSSLRELKATQPSLEAMNAIKQLQQSLPESFIRIPAISEAASMELQGIEKLYLLINTTIKNYETLCQVDGSWNDSSKSHVECAKRFYDDLRESEVLFAKTENDIVGLRRIASGKNRMNSVQPRKTASFNAN